MQMTHRDKPVHPLLAPFIVVWVVLVAMISVMLGILSMMFGLMMVMLTLPLHIFCRALGLQGFTRHHQDGTIEYAWYRNPFARSW